MNVMDGERGLLGMVLTVLRAQIGLPVWRAGTELTVWQSCSKGGVRHIEWGISDLL